MTVFVLTSTDFDGVYGETYEWGNYCSHECASTNPHYVAEDKDTWEEGEVEYTVALHVAKCEHCGERLEQVAFAG